MATISMKYFVPPNGEHTLRDFDVSIEHWQKAQSIIEKGYIFEAELLSTGHTSFTIGDPVKEEDLAYAIAITPDGAKAKVEDMIDIFYRNM